jgi:hypothetical protein
MSVVLRSALPAGLQSRLDAMISPILVPISAWPGPHATVLSFLLSVVLILEVLASDCRKEPPILREVREYLLFQVDDLGAHGFLLFWELVFGV